jgi:hypothetical protein
MNRAKPVEGRTAKKYLEPYARRPSETRAVREPSRLASLDRAEQVRKIGRTFPQQVLTHQRRTPLSIVVHRFEESIGGQVYLIEVSPVSTDRWRAQIARLPGVPTAMMPFYGRTPDEAARQLSRWLTRAHEHAHPSRTV